MHLGSTLILIPLVLSSVSLAGGANGDRKRGRAVGDGPTGYYKLAKRSNLPDHVDPTPSPSPSPSPSVPQALAGTTIPGLYKRVLGGSNSPRSRGRNSDPNYKLVKRHHQDADSLDKRSRGSSRNKVEKRHHEEGHGDDPSGYNFKRALPTRGSYRNYKRHHEEGHGHDGDLDKRGTGRNGYRLDKRHHEEDHDDPVPPSPSPSSSKPDLGEICRGNSNPTKPVCVRFSSQNTTAGGCYDFPVYNSTLWGESKTQPISKISAIEGVCILFSKPNCTASSEEHTLLKGQPLLSEQEITKVFKETQMELSMMC